MLKLSVIDFEVYECNKTKPENMDSLLFAGRALDFVCLRKSMLKQNVIVAVFQIKLGIHGTT